MKTEKKKYALVQISEELHIELKDYCKQNGYSMSGLISRLIRREIKSKAQ